MPDNLLVDVRLPEAEIAKLKEQLSPKQFQQANYQVVKKTTAKLVTLIRREVRGQVTISKKYVDRVIKQSGPSGDPPTGTVVVKKERIPLIAFSSRVDKRAGGVLVKVAKSLKPIQLKHGFFATVGKGAHEGIFLRARHLPSKGPNAGVLNKHGNPKFKLTPRGIAGRFAIEEQFGPSILKVISIPEVLKRIEFDSTEYMLEQIDSQLYRFTGIKPERAAPNEGDANA